MRMRRENLGLLQACSRCRSRLVSWWRRNDRGAVTAEFATVLPAVMVIALVLMGLGRAVAVSMSCQDAASAVARELIVRGADADPTQIARSVAGDGASASIDHAAGLVHVTVSCPVIPGPGNVIPAEVRGTAVGIDQ